MLAWEYDPILDQQANMEAGVEQGCDEEKISIVKKLLLAETSIEYIIAATGWTEEKILSLTEE